MGSSCFGEGDCPRSRGVWAVSCCHVTGRALSFSSRSDADGGSCAIQRETEADTLVAARLVRFGKILEGEVSLSSATSALPRVVLWGSPATRANNKQLELMQFRRTCTAQTASLMLQCRDSKNSGSRGGLARAARQKSKEVTETGSTVSVRKLRCYGGSLGAYRNLLTSTLELFSPERVLLLFHKADRSAFHNSSPGHPRSPLPVPGP